ncbi:iron ABC transporter permease [bacterium]|jgi:iron complex transport system permease protein|nr:iron ABC transporter permease [bacterium]
MKQVFLLILFSIVVLVVAPFVGGVMIDPLNIQDSDILYSLRIPRVLTTFLLGVILALGGVVFQALFRNPLATPFTLGVSSGAALGATVAIRFGFTFAMLGLSLVSWLAFAGALMAVWLVFMLSRVGKKRGSSTMLLSGVAVNFSLASLVMLIHYSSSLSGSFNILRWMMGRTEVVGYSTAILLFPVALLLSAALLVWSRELDLLTVGDDFAITRGVALGKIRTLMLVLVSVATGIAVSLSGPIGFVGLMAPHICRLLVGSGHRMLIPVTIFFGGSFLVACDTFARTIVAPTEIPVGVVTSLAGSLFFLWLLIKK